MRILFTCSIGSKFGLLYNGYVGSDARNIAPSGWRMPTDSDFSTLKTYLTDNGYGYEGSGDDIGKSLASKSQWTYNAAPGVVGNDQDSNNSSGFNAKPAGRRGVSGSTMAFQVIYGSTEFWTSSVSGVKAFYKWQMTNSSSSFLNVGSWDIYGYSIRLIKEDSSLGNGRMRDNNGFIYPTVKIGDQVWMSSNLKSTKFRNGDSIPEVTDATTWYNLDTATVKCALCAYDNDWSYV